MITKTKILVFTILIVNKFSVNAMAQTNEQIFTGIQSLHIISDEGKINVEGSKGSNLRMKHSFNGSDGRISTELKDGTLHVKNKKREGGGDCDFTLNAPKDLTVKVELGAGHVTVNNLNSDFNLDLGAGDVNVNATKLPSKALTLNLKTGAGKINVLLPRDSLVQYTKRPAVGWGQVNLLATETSGKDYHFLIGASNGSGPLTIKKYDEASY